ncbi:MAG: Lrp/AsnC family transcriptional regulator [Bacteroidetes bacterium]|nr:Lrp/AsnC family transcriptional regulator [Bacteroidota bacterium]
MHQKNSDSKGIDQLNLRILRCLQDDARLSITDIGKQVGLSGPAVSERLRRMEEEGVILTYATVIDYEKIGMPIQAFITLKSALTHAGVVKKLEEIPEITECFNITGNFCMIMKVITPTTRRLEAIIGQLQQLGETNTSIILSETFQKRGLLP